MSQKLLKKKAIALIMQQAMRPRVAVRRKGMRIKIAIAHN